MNEAEANRAATEAATIEAFSSSPALSGAAGAGLSACGGGSDDSGH